MDKQIFVTEGIRVSRQLAGFVRVLEAVSEIGWVGDDEVVIVPIRTFIVNLLPLLER